MAIAAVSLQSLRLTRYPERKRSQAKAGKKPNPPTTTATAYSGPNPAARKWPPKTRQTAHPAATRNIGRRPATRAIIDSSRAPNPAASAIRNENHEAPSHITPASTGSATAALRSRRGNWRGSTVTGESDTTGRYHITEMWAGGLLFPLAGVTNANVGAVREPLLQEERDEKKAGL